MLYSRMSHRNEKEQNSIYNKEESHKYNVEWKKLDRNEYTLYD